MFLYPTINVQETGKNIRKLCIEKDLSVTDVQNALHIGSNQAIYHWFNGRSLPSIDSFYALSHLLDTSIDQIIVESKAS